MRANLSVVSASLITTLSPVLTDAWINQHQANQHHRIGSQATT